MERCLEEMPELIEKDGHKVRCFLYECDKEGGKELMSENQVLVEVKNLVKHFNLENDFLDVQHLF